MPRQRALFPIHGIHVSRSLAKVLRQNKFRVTFDVAFEQVMRGCLRPEDNWISEPIIRTYTQIHYQGWGHSCECWLDDELVGGVYGIAVGTVFSAESMFHRATNASKVALKAMVEKCRDFGFEIFDAQVMNPHLASLGAFEMPQRTYLRMIRPMLERPTAWSRGIGSL